MAAGYLDPNLPCKDECKHKDCAATRTIAAALCYWCKQPIGYDTAFYHRPQEEEGGGWEHAVCLETAVEEGRV